MPKTKSPGTALTKWDSRLAELAKAGTKAVAAVGAGANFISLQGGIMSYRQAPMPDNKMRVIVMDHVIEHQLYEGKFDPETWQAPICYAFGRVEEDMAPNPEHVESPKSESCSDCELHEWGSADTGKGKACKDCQRLAVIPEGDLENIADAEIAFMKVPVTSAARWANYVRQLSEVYHRPPLAFVTEISVVKGNPGKLPGWFVDFKLVQPIEDGEVFEELLAKYEKVAATIMFPYPKAGEGEETEEDEEAPAPRAKKTAKKTKRTARTNGNFAAETPAAAPAVPTASSSPVKLGLKRPVKPQKF